MSKLEEVTPCDDADVVDSVGDEHDDKKKTKKNDADGVDDENENEEDNEEDEDDEDMTKNGDTSFARLANQLVAMIKQAEEAVEAPVRGRELKPRQLSNASQTSQLDFDSLMNDIDNYLEEGEENVGGDANQVSLTKKNAEEPVNDVKKEKKGHSKQKSRQEEEFNKSLDSLTNSFNTILAEIEHEVNDDHLIMKENGEILSSKMLASQYMDTQTLINHPSEDLADLDDFAQQCRLLTRAIILPFLHATHSFMSESLQTTKTSHTPRSVTSTTRSFMNLMYWTFLFTLGTLVLDAWLCEVAGQQVIRMVDMLKPGQTFTSSNDKSSNIIEHHDVNAIESDPQDGGMKMVEDCKKKNVKICTCLKMKAVTYLINNNDNFYNNGDCNYDEKQDIFSQSPISMNDSNYFINNRNNDNKRNSISSSGINYYNSSNDNNNIIIDQRRQSSYDILYDHEMEEYEEGEDIDLNIPGSFPSAFKWSPPSSYLIDNNIINKKDNVRRVKSVVLRRPKRIGSLSGSGGYWVVRSRKVRTRHNNNNNSNNNKIIPKRNSSSKFNSISKNKKMFSSTTSLPERIWIRRNSI